MTGPSSPSAASGVGALALIGGEQGSEGGGGFDGSLLASAGTDEVTVLPTAAAYEQPDAVVARARAFFESLGARVTVVNALDRRGAHDPDHVAAVRAGRLLYLTSGSAMHLLSVLKATPLWEAVLTAHQDGATVAAAGPSAVVLCDAMVDPRGGGFGVGLGLVRQLTLIPRYDQWSTEKSRRTIEMAPKGLVLVGVPSGSALVRERDGSWHETGAGGLRYFRDGVPVTLDSLSGLEG